MLSFKLVAALSLLTTALANPVHVPRQTQTCKPNFQGRGLTIFQQPQSTVFEWTPENRAGGHITIRATPPSVALTSDEFLVAFTGQADNTYTIKLIADTSRSLALTGKANGDLSFASESWKADQRFAINCWTCSTTEARAGPCVISHPATNLCVAGSADGVTLKLAQCDSTNNQLYHMWEGF